MTGRAQKFRLHLWVDRAVLISVAAAGVFHPNPLVWFVTFGLCFLVLVAAILGLAWTVTRWAEAKEIRIQGPRKKAAMIAAETKVTLKAMWVMAGLAAWPLAAARLGWETGFRWSLDGSGWTVPGALAVTGLGLVAVDAWIYWKHRALHSKALFGFHRDHHAFRDPTPFAGFAVGPLESLWTFCPVLIVLHPQALHWGPAYVSLVVGFVSLNMYLHCGVEVRWIEALLPKMGINTSAFHNVHHSHVRVNFGEAAIWWDRICKTRLADRPGPPQSSI